MRVHQIPKDVITYRFHIIGSMTLKQFAYLAVGAFVIFLFYVSTIPSFFKFIFIILTAMASFSIAFVPIEERPLDFWIITFLKAIYKPTKFYWDKNPKTPFYLQEVKKQEKTPKIKSKTKQEKIIKKQELLKQYLAQLEQNQSLNSQSYQDINGLTQNLQNTDDISDQVLIQYNENNTKNSTKKIKTNPLKGFISTIEQKVIKFEKDKLNKDQQQKTKSQDFTYIISDKQNQTINTQGLNNVLTNADLPFPEPPKEPNKIVGMTLSKNNQIIPNVFINIKDINGQTIMTLKSNSLGQFFSTRSLPDGEYIIESFKQDIPFNLYKLVLNGKIVKPLQIQALIDV